MYLSNAYNIKLKEKEVMIFFFLFNRNIGVQCTLGLVQSTKSVVVLPTHLDLSYNTWVYFSNIWVEKKLTKEN